MAIAGSVERCSQYRKARGTVQADILKEDQAQNTCIFSTEFAMRMMGDIQQYFVDHKEFESISERGGVLGAMDTMYQRSKIQEESMYYEHKKHDGSLPLIGVNTFLGGKDPHAEGGELELMCSTEEEKVQHVARARENTFEALMEAGKVCSLGSMSHALYEVGGEYRRNM